MCGTAGGQAPFANVVLSEKIRLIRADISLIYYTGINPNEYKR
jgi:hypothetical protein